MPDTAVIILDIIMITCDNFWIPLSSILFFYLFYLFSGKKLKYVCKHIYKKVIFAMKNKFRQQLRTQWKLENKINLHCCNFNFLYIPLPLVSFLKNIYPEKFQIRSLENPYIGAVFHGAVYVGLQNNRNISIILVKKQKF